VNGADQFHVGIVVDDLDTALAELTALFGYAWCPPIAVETPVVLPDDEIMLDLEFAYSATEPRVEMIRSTPGTLWMPASGSGIHHVGYWSDDLTADMDQLASQGHAQEARGEGPDGTAMWAYHRSPNGPRIELVSRVIQPGLEQYWASAASAGRLTGPL
jgi:glyoxalase/bleomycin resistance protein/dioxygenase superfamily protein